MLQVQVRAAILWPRARPQLKKKYLRKAKGSDKRCLFESNLTQGGQDQQHPIQLASTMEKNADT